MREPDRSARAVRVPTAALVASFLLTLTGSAPVAATAGISVEHRAPVPCATLCAHGDLAAAAGFHPCDAPFPAGSYDRSRFRFAAPGIISIESRPVVDYDMFVCTVTEPSRAIGNCGFPFKCTYAEDACSEVAGRDELRIGCPEYIDLTLASLHALNGGVNDEFDVVSYNWADHAPLPITLTGPVELLDDSFEARVV